MGAHLFECSGNNNPANFGLMSVAEWDGVPLTDVLSRLERDAGATAVLVSGVDPDMPVIHRLDRRGELGDPAGHRSIVSAHSSPCG